jgi:hypothetical protein
MKAPVKAGGESRMKEPYKKPVASHLHPESCAGAGYRLGEALAGASAGQPSSCDTQGATKCNHLPRHADLWRLRGTPVVARGAQNYCSDVDIYETYKLREASIIEGGPRRWCRRPEMVSKSGCHQSHEWNGNSAIFVGESFKSGVSNVGSERSDRARSDFKLHTSNSRPPPPRAGSRAKRTQFEEEFQV